MLHIFYYRLKQPEEEEEGEERKEVRLLAQYIQAAVTTTETLLIILEADKFKIKSLTDCGSCEASRCTKVPYLCLHMRGATRQLTGPLSQRPDNIPTQQRLHSLISTGTLSAFSPGVCDVHTDPSLCVVRPPHWTGGMLTINQTVLQSRRRGTTVEKQNENWTSN